MNSKILEDLNPQQKEVVTDTEGPLLVLAGAGSGKTRSIISRCAWLLREKNVPPWNILVVTFTNKAARELQERLGAMLGFPVSSLWVGTFHSICSRILRYESASLPFGSNFSIYDEDDKKSLLKKIYKEQGIDPKNTLSKASNPASAASKTACFCLRIWMQIPPMIPKNLKTLKAPSSASMRSTSRGCF